MYSLLKSLFLVLLFPIFILRGSSSAGRASASQAEGRGFESRLPLISPSSQFPSIRFLLLFSFTLKNTGHPMVLRPCLLLFAIGQGVGFKKIAHAFAAAFHKTIQRGAADLAYPSGDIHIADGNGAAYSSTVAAIGI
jgi:hypothetical protein